MYDESTPKQGKNHPKGAGGEIPRVPTGTEILSQTKVENLKILRTSYSVLRRLLSSKRVKFALN